MMISGYMKNKISGEVKPFSVNGLIFLTGDWEFTTEAEWLKYKAACNSIDLQTCAEAAESETDIPTSQNSGR